MSDDIERIYEFWFGKVAQPGFTLDQYHAQCETWFKASDATDQAVRERFGALLERAIAGELDGWAASPRGRVALIVLLDQFSRNAFRGSAKAFAQDPRALVFAREGVKGGVDAEVSLPERFMMYMPFMHAEDRDTQRESVGLYQRLRDAAPEDLRPEFAKGCAFAEAHARVVEMFGRYPHRNKVLGRPTTPEEEEAMKKPGFAF